jgi:hypothetical protein
MIVIEWHASGKCCIKNESVMWGLEFVLWATELVSAMLSQRARNGSD